MKILSSLATALPLLVLTSVTATAAEHGGLALHGARSLAGLALLLPIVLAIKTGWLALALLGAALRPAACRRGANLAEQHFGRSFLVGLLTLMAFLLLGWLAFRIPFPWRRLATLPLIALFLLHALAGFTVLATALGERIEANLGHPGGSTVRAVLLGGAILVLAGLFPLLGQFAEFILLAAGLGVTTELLLSARK